MSSIFGGGAKFEFHVFEFHVDLVGCALASSTSLRVLCLNYDPAAFHGWVKWLDPAEPEQAHDFVLGLRRPVNVRFDAEGSLYVRCTSCYETLGGSTGNSKAAPAR